MATKPSRPRFASLIVGRPLVLLLLVASLMAVAVTTSAPPSRLFIESGPVGGSYHRVALEYQKLLAARGITVTVRPNPNSMGIIQNVADPSVDADVGFIAQDVSAQAQLPVMTVGQIQMQPLFVFASAELGRRSVLDDLRGRRIVMPPKDSATTVAAIEMLKLYDITETNSSFTFMPLAEAVGQLREGRFQGGLFMLAAENDLIRGMMADSGLRLVPYTEARAVANHMPFLRPVVLPRGIYNIADAIPPVDTPLVAATVGVVVRADLHPYLVYALLEAMSIVHRPPTFLNASSEFPTLTGSQLTAHPIALEFYRSGLPWTYRKLPPWLAAAIEHHDFILLPLLAIGTLFLVMGAIWDLIVGFAVMAMIATIQRIDRSSADRGSLSAAQRARLALAEFWLDRLEPAHDLRARIEEIRGRNP
jgi:TRAP-type uncharacterized transport system substrate-binding protein